MRHSVTSTDIAQAARVSTMTVSRFFNAPEKLSERTRVRVAAAVDRLGYVQNRTARAFFHGESRSLALVVPNITNPFNTTVARGVEDAAHAAGLTVYICNSDEDPDKERGYIADMVGRRVDGTLVVPAEPNGGGLSALARHRIPTVLIDQPIAALDVDVVRADSYQGARLLVRRLLDPAIPDDRVDAIGCTRIAFIGGPVGSHSTDERVRGLVDELRPRGIQLDVVRGPFRLEVGITQVHELDRKNVLAPILIAANNVLGLGVLKGLAAIGKRRAVASFDPLAQEFRGLYDPFVAVVRQDAYAIGRQACELLLARIADPDAPVTERILPMQIDVGWRTGANA